MLPIPDADSEDIMMDADYTLFLGEREPINLPYLNLVLKSMERNTFMINDFVSLGNKRSLGNKLTKCQKDTMRQVMEARGMDPDQIYSFYEGAQWVVASEPMKLLRLRLRMLGLFR